MTDSPAIQLVAGGPKARLRGRVLAPARYRHPGDVIGLIAAALVLAVVAVVLPALLRPGAAAITGLGPAATAGRVLTGVVQVTIATAALVLLIAALRCRRFRVLAIVPGGFAAAALMARITNLAGPGGSAGLPAGLRQGSRRLPRSGCPGGTGGGRGGRGLSAEPAAGGPLALQALEAGEHGRRAAVQHRSSHHGRPPGGAGRRPRPAAGRERRPAGAPGCRRPPGPAAILVLDAVSARLTTGSLHARDARAELRGQDPRLVAQSWLRAQGLASAGGALH